MRTVIKKVIRSVSASDSAAFNFMRRESQLKVDINHNRSKNDFASPEILNSISIQNKSTNALKNNSLSPSYKLSFAEESSFEELLDKECDYYPDNSRRGDMKVLNMKNESTAFMEKNVNSDTVIVSLKNIRFINSIVFNESPLVFLMSANYIQRLLYRKAVKKDLMPFIVAAVYDLALEYKTRKALTNDHRTCLLSVSRIPLNHIEDFSRIKELLLDHLNNDLQFIIITDYLQILLKIDIDQFGGGSSSWGTGGGFGVGNLPESHAQLLEIACVLATSCELTHFSLACQALSLVNLAARHVSLNKSFLHEFSHIIGKFPLIFLSPVRLNRFANVANVDEYVIEQCTESIIRYYAKYYAASPKRSVISLHKKRCSVPLYGKYSLENQLFHSLSPVPEETSKNLLLMKHQKNLNIDELIDKLNKVRLAAINSHMDGRQKKRHKRIKRNLSRQLKIYRKKDEMITKQCLQDFSEDEEEDSAISSSSNVTSSSNSPRNF